MKRLFLFVFLAYSCSVLAQKNTNKDFYNYLLTIMHQNYDERRANVQKAFESKENLKQYQAACSKEYLKLIPDFYQQLDSSVPEVYSKASIQCDGYRVERIILNKRISANLYLPDSKGKKATALFLCGHEKTGKATESYQQTAILLAKNNFIVLVPDPTGQGERLQLIDRKGKPLVPRATSEHTLLNQTAKLVGWSIPEEELKDNFSLMNYLCSLSAVDTSAIACIGNSGGGTQATFLSALDKRIEAVVCCSWFTQRERMYRLHGPDDGCQYFCGEGKLEIADYYMMRAPKPVLILAGKQDFIDYQGSLEAFEELKSAYKMLNCPEKADFFSVDDGHGISLEKREKTVAFLKHCLLNDNSPIISEKDINSLPLTPEMLNCTQSGQMLLDYPQLSFLQEISLRNNLLTNVRNKFSELSLGEKQAHIKMLLNIPDTLPTLEYKATEAYSGKGMQVHEFIFQRKNEFPLSATLIYDLKRYTDQDVFIILCSDSSFFSQKEKKIKQLLQKGYAVLLGEVRGCGNLADNPLSNNKKFYNDNYRTSALSLILGKPLVGQQVIDIYSYVDFANRHPLLQQAKIHCISWGSVGLAAKHAKLLDARIASLQAEHLLHSFDKIIANPIQKNQLDLIVPNILKYYDISSLNQ